MPGQEPPASVHLRVIGVGYRGAHRVMIQSMRAPALRIIRITLRPALHFADRRIEGGEMMRRKGGVGDVLTDGNCRRHARRQVAPAATAAAPPSSVAGRATP